MNTEKQIKEEMEKAIQWECKYMGIILKKERNYRLIIITRDEFKNKIKDFAQELKNEEIKILVNDEMSYFQEIFEEIIANNTTC